MNPTKNPIALRSQKELANALLKLMQTTPYAEISVKQILLESKLSRKTFYRNFNDKQDLLNYYLDTLLLEYSSEIAIKNDYHFPEMLEVITRFVLKNQEQLSLFWSNHLEYMILQKLNEFIIQKHNEIRHNNTTCLDDYIVMLNNGAIWNVLNEWMRRGRIDSLEQILLELKEYMLHWNEYDLKHLCSESIVTNEYTKRMNKD